MSVDVDEPPVEGEVTAVGGAFPDLADRRCREAELFGDFPNDRRLLCLTGLDSPAWRTPVTGPDHAGTSLDDENAVALPDDRHNRLRAPRRLPHISRNCMDGRSCTLSTDSGSSVDRAERAAAAADRRNLIRVMPAKGGRHDVSDTAPMGIDLVDVRRDP